MRFTPQELTPNTNSLRVVTMLLVGTRPAIGITFVGLVARASLGRIRAPELIKFVPLARSKIWNFLPGRRGRARAGRAGPGLLRTEKRVWSPFPVRKESRNSRFAFALRGVKPYYDAVDIVSSPPIFSGEKAKTSCPRNFMESL